MEVALNCRTDEAAWSVVLSQASLSATWSWHDGQRVDCGGDEAKGKGGLSDRLTPETGWCL